MGDQGRGSLEFGPNPDEEQSLIFLQRLLQSVTRTRKMIELKGPVCRNWGSCLLFPQHGGEHVRVHTENTGAFRDNVKSLL